LGLYYLEELTMKEVGVILNIGESRVSQIHTAALARLRSRLQDRMAPGASRRPPPNQPTKREDA
jgi:RNA polymerase sigma factor for flagellar operon FliA